MKPLRLTNLPQDVLLRVYNFLHVKEIVVLRMTCRTLARFSNERSIWINATKAYCARHQMPLCSFRLDVRSSTQLERALSTPYTFVANMLGNRQMMYAERVMRLSYPNDDLEAYIETIIVIPGGRYIVTGSSTGWIVCWDIDSDNDNHPVACAAIQVSFKICLMYFNVAPGHDAYMITVSDDEDSLINLQYMTLDISNAVVNLRSITSVCLQVQGGKSLETSGDTGATVILAAGVIVVHYSQTGEFACIDISSLDDEEDYQNSLVYFGGSTAFLVSTSELTVRFHPFEIPPTHSSLEEARENCSLLSPLSVVFRHPSAYHMSGSDLRVIALPQRASSFPIVGNPLWYYILSMIQVDDGLIQIVSPMSKDMGHSFIMPTYMCEPWPIEDETSSFYLLEELICATWHEGGEIFAMVQSIDHGNRTGLEVSQRIRVGWLPAVHDADGDVKVQCNMWRGEFYAHKAAQAAHGEVRVYFPVNVV